MLLIDHIVLNVEDTDAMIAFYVDIIGLAPERVEAYCAGKVFFPSLRINADTLIDLMPPAMWAQTDAAGEGRNLDHFCLSMSEADWKAALARFSEAGGQLEAEPMTLWGAHGDATAVYLRDPEGNRIELRYYD
jgi:catechol 2,3-dioxygenase-like lactoylglutathione lyase family enzyme